MGIIIAFIPAERKYSNWWIFYAIIQIRIISALFYQPRFRNNRIFALFDLQTVRCKYNSSNVSFAYDHTMHPAHA